MPRTRSMTAKLCSSTGNSILDYESGKYDCYTIYPQKNSIKQCTEFIKTLSNHYLKDLIKILNVDVKSINYGEVCNFINAVVESKLWDKTKSECINYMLTKWVNGDDYNDDVNNDDGNKDNNKDDDNKNYNKDDGNKNNNGNNNDNNKHNSTLSPYSIFFCAAFCKEKILRTLSTRIKNLNPLVCAAKRYTPYYWSDCGAASVMGKMVQNVKLIDYPGNIYWLIIYGGDVYVEHACEQVKNTFCCFHLCESNSIFDALIFQMSKFKDYPADFKRISKAWKSSKKAIKKMKEEVIISLSDCHGNFVFDLYGIIFAYLAWPK